MTVLPTKTAALSEAGDKVASFYDSDSPILTIYISEITTENVHVPAQSITLVSTEIERLRDFLNKISG